MSLRSYLPSLPPLLFALVFLSVVSSKSLHLLQHVRSLPLLYLILFSPTLILQDVFVITVSRMLLVSPESRLRLVACLFGGFIAYVYFPSSSSEQWLFIVLDTDWLDFSHGLLRPSRLASSLRLVPKLSGRHPIVLFGIQQL